MLLGFGDILETAGRRSARTVSVERRRNDRTKGLVETTLVGGEFLRVVQKVLNELR